MTSTETAQTPPERAEGWGEMIRALRLYTGLSQRELARRIAVDRRTYQRIENGRELCPVGFIDTMRTVAHEFDDQIDVVLAAAETMVGDSGRPAQIQVREGDEFAWERAVIGRAAVESVTIVPIMVGNNQQEAQPA